MRGVEFAVEKKTLKFVFMADQVPSWPPSASPVTGSLILTSKDQNTRRIFYYNSESNNCELENIEGRGLKVSSMEIHGVAAFTLFSKKNGLGISLTVSLESDLSGVTFSKVKSIKREGC